MKTLRAFLAVSAAALIAASATAVYAGPGVDYWNARFKRANEKAAAAPDSGCKITHVTRAERSYHGTIRKVITGTEMDCSKCGDKNMACCAGKAGS